MRKNAILIITVFLLCMETVRAGYVVKGQVNMSDRWRPQIFMAAITSLDDYYNAYPDLIIDAAIIQPDGTFILQGDNLPDDPYFYRLYLMKTENSEFDACLYVGGEDHNFMHIILDNDTEIEISVDTSGIAPFADYQVRGDLANEQMVQVANFVLPKFYFYQIKYPSELKFSREKLNHNLIQFADTCSSVMAGLAAIINSDFDKYYPDNRSVYLDFQNRFSTSNLNVEYAQDLARKVLYHDPDSLEQRVRWKDYAIILLTMALLILGFAYFQKSKEIQPAPADTLPIDQLTNKELEIFRLIGEQKSNKEIAQALFIEISTVKTHINNIYNKLNITSRKKAVQLAKLSRLITE